MRKALFFILISSLNVWAQEKPSDSTKFKLDISGYIETYYNYDFNKPQNKQRQSFFYNHNRHNEFNLNLALLRTSISYENYYAKIAVQAGTYVEDNYANEDLKLINEAYIGTYLDKNQKMSIDAGIFTSHIGFETATSASNLNVTRSILAENSPYFLSGIRFNYKPNDKWIFTGILNNGWQRVNKPNRKALPVFGTQITYKSSSKNFLNWSTYVGDESVANNLRTRYFSNWYWDCQWNDKWRTILGFDYGLQKRNSGKEFSNWYSPVLIAQYSLTKKLQVAYRSEYYQDKENVIIASNYGNFKTLGNSLNLDFVPNSKVKLRTEARWLHAQDEVFKTSTGYSNDDFFATTTLSFEF